MNCKMCDKKSGWMVMDRRWMEGKWMTEKGNVWTGLDGGKVDDRKG